MTSHYLVSTDWLAPRLGSPDLAIIDASWHMPAAQRNGQEEYSLAHIPGAVFFDIDEVCDKTSTLPHMLPDTKTFASAAGKLGIRETMTIVVYDSVGLFSAPRVWWMFRIFGARHVFILDGGLPAWRRENRPVSSTRENVHPARFNASLDSGQVWSAASIEAGISTGNFQLVDARPQERFTGSVPEPRPGVRPGHIPGAINLPFTSVITDGRLASLDQIRQAAEAKGIDLSKPVVTSCGSGVTAAVLALAFQSINAPFKGIYDGSWTEWGARHDLPAATGHN